MTVIKGSSITGGITPTNLNNSKVIKGDNIKTDRKFIKSNPTQSYSATRSDIGAVTMDELTGTFQDRNLQFQSGTDAMEIIAQQQSSASKYWNTAKKIPMKTGTLTGEAAGYVGGGALALVNYAATGNGQKSLDIMNNNFLNEFSRNVSASIDANWKNYKTHSYLDSDNAFTKILGEGADTMGEALSFLGSMFIPGAVAGKIGAGAKIVGGLTKASMALNDGAKAMSIATKLAKMGNVAKAEKVLNAAIKAGKLGKELSVSKLLSGGLKAPSVIARNAEKITKGIDFMGLHTYNVGSEAAFEANGTIVDVYNEHLFDTGDDGNLLSNEVLQKTARDAWKKTFVFNVGILSLTNLPETMAIFKTFNANKLSYAAKKAAAAGKKLTKKQIAGEYLKGAAKVGFSEGVIEEGGQLAIENMAKDVANEELTGDTKGTLHNIQTVFNNMVNNFDTVEGRESMLSGAIIGMLFGSGNVYHDRIAKQKQVVKALFSQQSRMAIVDNFKKDVLTKDENGTYQYDHTKLVALASEIMQADEIDSFLANESEQMGSVALFNHLMNRRFSDLMHSAIMDGSSASDVNDEINYFMEAHKEMLASMPEGPLKEGLLEDAQGLKKSYQKTAQIMEQAWKKAKGQAYELAIQYKKEGIETDKLQSYQQDLYAANLQAATALDLITNLQAEVTKFENDNGLIENKEHNDEVADYKHAKALLKAELDNQERAKQKISHIEKLIKKEKEKEVIASTSIATSDENETTTPNTIDEYGIPVNASLGTLTDLLKTNKTSLADLSKNIELKQKHLEAVPNEVKNSNFKVDANKSGKGISERLHEEYSRKTSVLKTLGNFVKAQLQEVKKLDDAEFIKKYVEETEAARKIANEVAEKKAEESLLNEFKESVNKIKSKTSKGYLRAKAVALRKGKKYKAVLDNHMAGISTIEDTKVTTEPETKVTPNEESKTTKESKENKTTEAAEVTETLEKDKENKANTEKKKELKNEDLDTGEITKPVAMELTSENISNELRKRLKLPELKGEDTLESKYHEFLVEYVTSGDLTKLKKAIAARILIMYNEQILANPNFLLTEEQLKNVISFTEKTLLKDINTTLPSTTTEAIRNVVEEANKGIKDISESANKFVKTTLEDIHNTQKELSEREESTKIAIENATKTVETEDINSLNSDEIVSLMGIFDDIDEEFDIEIQNNTSHEVVGFIPLLHTKDKRTVNLGVKDMITFEALQKGLKDGEFELKLGKDTRENKKDEDAIHIMKDGVTVGFMQTPAYLEKEIKLYSTIREAIAKELGFSDFNTLTPDELNKVNDKINTILLDIRNAFNNLYKTIEHQKGNEKKATINARLKRIQKAFLNYGIGISLSDVIRLGRRVNFQYVNETGKYVTTQTPINEFNNWSNKMVAEHEKLSNIWDNASNSNTEKLVVKVSTSNRGGLVKSNNNIAIASLKNVLSKDEIENGEFVYKKNGQLVNIRTGESLDNNGISYTEDVGKDDGLIYYYTDKTINGEKILIPLFPNKLDKAHTDSVFDAIVTLIKESGKGGVDTKTSTPEQIDALRQIGMHIFESHNTTDGEKRNARASYVVNSKDGGFVINLKSETEHHLIIVKDGGVEIKKVTKDGSKQITNSGIDNFYDVLKDIIGDLKFNPDFNQLQNEEHRTKVLNSNLLSFRNKFIKSTQTGRVVSFTRGRGTNGMNFRMTFSDVFKVVKKNATKEGSEQKEATSTPTTVLEDKSKDTSEVKTTPKTKEVTEAPTVDPSKGVHKTKTLLNEIKEDTSKENKDLSEMAEAVDKHTTDDALVLDSKNTQYTGLHLTFNDSSATFINFTKIGDNKRLRNETILHETIHKLSDIIIYNGEKGNKLNALEQEYYNNVKALYEEFLDYLDAENIKETQVITEAKESILEFNSYGLTDANFIKLLDKIEVEDASLFEKLIDAIVKYFTLNNKTNVSTLLRKNFMQYVESPVKVLKQASIDAAIKKEAEKMSEDTSLRSESIAKAQSEKLNELTTSKVESIDSDIAIRMKDLNSSYKNKTNSAFDPRLRQLINYKKPTLSELKSIDKLLAAVAGTSKFNKVLERIQDKDFDKVLQVVNDLTSSIQFNNINHIDSIDITLDNGRTSELSQKLLSFLNSVNFTVEFKEELKSETGFQAASFTSLIHKMIQISEKGVEEDSLVEAVGHVMFTLLGKKNKLRHKLIVAIESLDNYDEIFNTYKERMPSYNDYYIKGKIAGDFLADAIRNNFNTPTDSKIHAKSEFWGLKSKTKLGKKVEYNFNKLKRWYKDNLGIERVSKEEATDLFNSLANDILNTNSEQWSTKLNPEAQQVYYESTIKNDKKGKEINDFMMSIKLILTGSLALRKSGSMFRTANETLHDLDYSLPFERLSYADKKLIRKLRNFVKNSKDLSKQEINKNKRIVEQSLKANFKKLDIVKSILKKYPNFKFKNAIANKDGNLTLTGSIPFEGKNYDIDIFFINEDVESKTDKGFQNWEHIIAAKLQMGRFKDINDYFNFQPLHIERDSNLAKNTYRNIQFHKSVHYTGYAITTDAYEMAEALVLNNIMTQGNFKSEHIAEAIATIIGLHKNKSGKVSDVYETASEVLDIIYDIQQKYDTRPTIDSKYPNLGRSSNVNDVIAENKFNPNGEFVSLDTINNDVKTIYALLHDENLNYLSKLDGSNTHTARKIFKNTNTPIKLEVSPSALKSGALAKIEAFISNNGGKIKSNTKSTFTNDSVLTRFNEFKDKSYFSHLFDLYNGKEAATLEFDINGEMLDALNILLGDSSSFEGNANTLISQVTTPEFKDMLNDTAVLDKGVTITSLSISNSEIEHTDKIEDYINPIVESSKLDSKSPVIEALTIASFSVANSENTNSKSSSQGKMFAGNRASTTIIVDELDKGTISDIRKSLKEVASKIRISVKDGGGVISYWSEGIRRYINVNTPKQIVTYNTKDTAVQLLGHDGYIVAYNALTDAERETVGFGETLNDLKRIYAKDKSILKEINQAEQDFKDGKSTVELQTVMALAEQQTVNISNFELTQNLTKVEDAATIIHLLRSVDGARNYNYTQAARLAVGPRSVFGEQYSDAIEHLLSMTLSKEGINDIYSEIEIKFGIGRNAAKGIFASAFKNFQLTGVTDEIKYVADSKVLMALAKLVKELNTNDKLKALYDSISKFENSSSNIKVAYDNSLSDGLYKNKLDGHTLLERKLAINKLTSLFIDAMDEFQLDENDSVVYYDDENNVVDDANLGNPKSLFELANDSRSVHATNENGSSNYKNDIIGRVAINIYNEISALKKLNLKGKEGLKVHNQIEHLSKLHDIVQEFLNTSYDIQASGKYVKTDHISLVEAAIKNVNKSFDFQYSSLRTLFENLSDLNNSKYDTGSSVSKLYNDNAIEVDMDKDFTPLTKQTISKLHKIHIGVGSSGVVTAIAENEHYGGEERVEFNLIFPKIIMSLVGSPNEARLIERIKEMAYIIPELNELLAIMENNPDIKQSIMTDLNKIVVKEEYLDDTRDKIKKRNKDIGYLYVDAWSENIKSKVIGKPIDGKQKLDIFIKNNEIGYRAFLEAKKEFKNGTGNKHNVVLSLLNMLKGIGVDLTTREFYMYAFDPNSPTSLAADTNSKIDLAIAKIVDKYVYTVNSTKEAVIKSRKPIGYTEFNEPIFGAFEFDSNDDLKFIGDIKAKYGNDVIKLVYKDVNNNSKSAVNKVSAMGKFVNLMRNGNRQDKLDFLTNLLKDPALKHSNLLVSISNNGKIVKPGFLNIVIDENGTKSYDLNDEFIATFDYSLVGGLQGKNASFTYKELSNINWRYLKLKSYFATNSSANRTVKLTGIIPGDASNNYMYTIQKVPVDAKNIRIIKGKYHVTPNSDLHKALINVVTQELVRMHEAKHLMYDKTDTGWQLKTTKELNKLNLIKNYHYILNNDGSRQYTYIAPDGMTKPVGNAFRFHNFTTLNDVGYIGTNGLLYDNYADLTVDGKSAMNISIGTVFNELLQDTKNVYTDYKQFFDKENDNNYVNISNIHSDNNMAMLDYVINTKLFNIEHQNLFSGVTAEFELGILNGVAQVTKKGLSQIVVRAKSMHQAGTEAYGKEGDSKVKIGVIKDSYIKSFTVDEQLKDVKKQLVKDGFKEGTKAYNDRLNLIEKGLKGLKGLNRGDGQGWMSITRWVKIQKQNGRWNEYKSLFNVNTIDGKTIYSLKPNIPFVAMVKMFQIQKPVYVKRDLVSNPDGSSILANEYIKYASFPLMEEFTKFHPELDSIRKFMEENGYDELMYESAEKQGATFVTSITDDNGNLKHDTLGEITPKILDLTSFRTQLELKEHAIDEENKLGVQIQKSIIANIKSTNKYKYKNGTLDGDAVIKEHFDLITSIVSKNFISLLNRLNLEVDENGFLDFKDMSEIRDIFMEEMSRTGLSADDAKLFFVNTDGKFDNTLDINRLRAKIISVYTAQFTNNVKNTKFNGSHLTLLSDSFIGLGITKQEDLEARMEHLGLSAEELQGPLKVRKIDGVWVADILIPANKKEFYKTVKDPVTGKQILTNEHIPLEDISPELLQAIGYRIPSTGKHSNIAFRVVGFTPRVAGNIIITPVDFVGQTGWDFDVDSVFMMDKNVMSNPDKTGKYKFIPYSRPSSWSTYISESFNEELKINKSNQHIKNYRKLSGLLNTKSKQIDTLWAKMEVRDKNNKVDKIKSLSNKRKVRVYRRLVKEQKQLAEQRSIAKKAILSNMYNNNVIVSEKDWIEETQGLKTRDTLKSLQNDLFDLWYSIQTNPAHLTEVKSPSYFGNVSAIRDKYRAINDNRISPESKNVRNNPSTLSYQDEIFNKAVIDKNSLALYASNGSMLNVHEIIGTKLDKPIAITYSIDELGLNDASNLIENVNTLFKNYKVSYISKSELIKGIKSGKTKKVTTIHNRIGRSSNNTFNTPTGESISQIVSGFTDNAADAIKDNLPDAINPYTIGAHIFGINTGINIDHMTAIIEAPFVKRESKIKNASDKVFTESSNFEFNTNDAYLLILANDPSIIATIKTLKSEEAKTLLKKINKGLNSYNTDKNSIKGIDLSNYIQYLTGKEKATLESVIIENVDKDLTTDEIIESNVNAVNALETSMELTTTEIDALKKQFIIYNTFREFKDLSSSVLSITTVLSVEKTKVGSNFNDVLNKISTIEDAVLSFLNYPATITSKNNLPVLVDVFPSVAINGLLKELVRLEEQAANGGFMDLIKDINKKYGTNYNENDNILDIEKELGITDGLYAYHQQIVSTMDSLENHQSTYPSMEDKLLKGDMAAIQSLSKFMLSAKNVFTKNTISKLFKEFKIEGSRELEKVEHFQNILTNFTLTSLSGEMINNFAKDRLGSQSYSEFADAIFTKVNDFLTNPDNVNFLNDAANEYLFIKNIEIAEPYSYYGTPEKILKFNAPHDIDVIDEFKSLTDAIFDSKDDKNAPKEYEELRDILNDVIALSYIKNGMGYDSYRLSEIVTNHIQNEFMVFDELNRVKDVSEQYPEVLEQMLNDIYMNFKRTYISTEFIAPSVKLTTLKKDSFKRLNTGNLEIKLNSGMDYKASSSQYIKITNKEKGINVYDVYEKVDIITDEVTGKVTSYIYELVESKPYMTSANYFIPESMEHTFYEREGLSDRAREVLIVGNLPKNNNIKICK